MSAKARVPTARDLAAAYGPKALEQLARLAGLVEGSPGASSEATRVAALTQLLDRAYGKATQPIAAETDDGAHVPVAIKFVIVDPANGTCEPISGRAASGMGSYS